MGTTWKSQFLRYISITLHWSKLMLLTLMTLDQGLFKVSLYIPEIVCLYLVWVMYILWSCSCFPTSVTNGSKCFFLMAINNLFTKCPYFCKIQSPKSHCLELKTYPCKYPKFTNHLWWCSGFPATWCVMTTNFSLSLCFYC